VDTRKSRVRYEASSCFAERSRLLTKQVARPLHHDVVVVPVAYPQDTRGNAVAGAGAREILHRLRILVSCERQEWFVSIASFPLEEVRQSLLSCRQDTHR
jgi:hypothetical protein